MSSFSKWWETVPELHPSSMSVHCQEQYAEMRGAFEAGAGYDELAAISRAYQARASIRDRAALRVGRAMLRAIEDKAGYKIPDDMYDYILKAFDFNLERDNG